MTVNGYIAKENDDTPWSEVEWKSYTATVKKYKALIVGRKTYEIMRQRDEFNKIGSPLVIVLTKKKQALTANTFFVTSPKEALQLLEQKGIKQAIVGGGSHVNKSFLKENLVDELIVDIEPLIFGRGIKLFAEEDFEKSLEIIETKQLSNNEIQLHYKVIK